jgi:hypothetical protein
MEKEVHMGVVIEDYNWSFIYCIPFSVTKDTKLQDFQYKLIHRILIKFNFPIPLIRSFHLCGMALRILKYYIKFNPIL